MKELADAVLDGNGLLLKTGVADHPSSHEMPLLDGILSEKLPTVIGWFKDNHPVRYGWVGAADGCLGNAHFLDGLCEGQNRCLEVEFELIFGNFTSSFHNRYRYEWESRSGTARHRVENASRLHKKRIDAIDLDFYFVASCIPSLVTQISKI